MLRFFFNHELPILEPKESTKVWYGVLLESVTHLFITNFFAEVDE